MDAVGEPRGGWPSSEMESSGAAGGGSHAPTLPPSPGAKWTPERRRGGSVAPIKRSVLLPFHPSRPQTSLRWGEPVAAQQAAGWPSAAGGSSPWCTCSAASRWAPRAHQHAVAGWHGRRGAQCCCRWGWAHTQPARAPTRRRLPLTSREWPLLPRLPARMRCRARSKSESAQTVSVGMSTCTCHNHAGVRRGLRPPHACVSVTGARRPSPHVTLPWREMDRCRGV